MATPAERPSQEYWRPSNPDVARVIPSLRGICWRCGMDYSPGARFCHFCGGAREAQFAEARGESQPPLPDNEFMAFLQRFGLSIASVVFLVIGVVCALSALLTGLVYRQDTWEYWQAVHTWRIEWLLAAVVAMLAAILLKKQAT
jgi:hypothetical protein